MKAAKQRKAEVGTGGSAEMARAGQLGRLKLTGIAI